MVQRSILSTFRYVECWLFFNPPSYSTEACVTFAYAFVCVLGADYPHGQWTRVWQ